MRSSRHTSKPNFLAVVATFREATNALMALWKWNGWEEDSNLPASIRCRLVMRVSDSDGNGNTKSVFRLTLARQKAIYVLQNIIQDLLNLLKARFQGIDLYHLIFITSKISIGLQILKSEVSGIEWHSDFMEDIGYESLFGVIGFLFRYLSFLLCSI